MINCAKCNNETNRLAIFPGGLCVECYSVTPEANREITAQELTRMWGGR
jgi:hypothetical protein